MARTTCLVCLVSTISGHLKNTLKSKRLLAGKKQSKQADSGVRAAWDACFCFVPATSILVLLKWMFHKLSWAIYFP